MDENTNSLNWFEIPVNNISRAKSFYQKIFGIVMDDMDMNETRLAFFPWSPGSGKANGTLVQHRDYKPSKEGCLIYLNANPALNIILDKVEKAGGKVIMSKTSIGDHGYIAYFLDTEGNKIGLHSNG
ncbi:VOC family protein [Membranihabitans marinus]|uniref:VOC family protein n=1 Tax=Membranihabitans marinus TaxID=1227546 RepID=UPI001F1E0ACC|nr:VOC family protein [Membranihabitans marinus]